MPRSRSASTKRGVREQLLTLVKKWKRVTANMHRVNNRGAVGDVRALERISCADELESFVERMSDETE